MSQLIFVRNEAQAASPVFARQGQGSQARHRGQRPLSRAAAREGRGVNGSISLGALMRPLLFFAELVLSSLYFLLLFCKKNKTTPKPNPCRFRYLTKRQIILIKRGT